MLILLADYLGPVVKPRDDKEKEPRDDKENGIHLLPLFIL